MSISREELLAFLEDLRKEGYVVDRLDRIKDGDLVTFLEEFNRFMDDVNELIQLRKEFLALNIVDAANHIDLITAIERDLWNPDAVDELRRLIGQLKMDLASSSSPPTQVNVPPKDEKKHIWLETHTAVQSEVFNLARQKIDGGSQSGNSVQERDKMSDQTPHEDSTESQLDDSQTADMDGKDDVVVDDSRAVQGPPVPENPISTAESPSPADADSNANSGNGGEACKFCKGTGICSSCGGSGECYWCKGTGVINKNGEEKTCPYCEGTGKCYWCKGTGKCAKCGGTGIRGG